MKQNSFLFYAAQVKRNLGLRVKVRVENNRDSKRPALSWNKRFLF